MLGSVDILKYTGEGGTRWPATAGPAEQQLSTRMGIPYVPIPGVGQLRQTGAAKKAGTFSFTAKVKRVPGASGKKVTLSLRFTNAKGKLVKKMSLKRAAGKKASLKVSGVAVPGSYKWALTAGKKSLARGKFRVKSKKGEAISAGATLTARVK
jgi:hypothetical protein